MKNRTFGSRLGATLVVALGAVLAFAAIGGAGLAGGLAKPAKSQYGPGQYQYGAKVTICHKQKVTIRVSVNAVPAHMKQHGDTLGPCATASAAKAKAAKLKAAKAAKAEKAAKAAKAAKVAKVAKVAKAAKATAPSTETAEAAKPSKPSKPTKAEKPAKAEKKAAKQARSTPAAAPSAQAGVVSIGFGKGNGNGCDGGGPDRGPPPNPLGGEHGPVAPHADDDPAVERPQAVRGVERHGRLAR